MKQIKMKQPLAYYQNMMKPNTIKITFCPRLDTVFLKVTTLHGSSETHALSVHDIEEYDGDLIDYYLKKMRDDFYKELLLMKTMLDNLSKGVKK